ncbi:cytoskeleton-associated protein 5 [Aplysia californica]|uniref:Cytoskeleton-associated protein 5 n=1 Tax=Aplysia californica TaxID=6500 RepID=A0ABM0K2U3_APLCA|nr:cytoskeleton-associated protein 5 [Aplysia californica]XP_035828069.1 cytoskeleton-associated protein 5 [Aplysia californica]
MGDDSEWQKLPTEEKCQHKVWKARVAGYEEATKLFRGLDEKSQEFSRYAGLMKKFVTDSNAVAQEKGLDAVLAFIENASTNICGRTCHDVVSGVVTKCLNASKQKTKEKGMEIIMLYVEAEKPDIVQECLMTGMENKQPKVVVGCVQTVTMALRDFGTKVIQVKPLLKLLPKLLDDRDKNVREETKQLVIELYRWIGAALKPQMTNFKPIQVQEFEGEFEKLPPGKPVQSRFMRSQQELKAKIEEQAAAAEGTGDGGGDGGANEEEAIDPFDLMTAVDILEKLPKNFYEQIEAKKWQERKEVLEAVQKLSENPKLENGDYSALLRAVLKVIAKDTNVMLVALAGKTVSGIANGLRKKYQPYAVMSVSTILEKFKEKKAAVVAALRDAIDASFQATNLEAIMEEVTAALDNKNPSIKAETALFLSRCFARCTQSSLPKKMLKAYCAPLLKTVNESDPAVREASFQALGTAMKVVTEKNIAPFLVDVDNIKMQKIQESCEKAVLLNAKGEPRGGGGASAAPAAAPAKRPSTAPPAKSGSEEPKPVKRPGTAKPAAGGAAKAKPKAKAPPKKGKKGPVEEKMESVLSDEAVEEKAQDFLPGDTLTNLASANWKERLAAMEGMVKVVSSTGKDDIPCQVCIRVLSKKPGLKETNFQVLKLKLELVAHLSRNAKFTKRSAEFCLADIVDKLGDAKNGAAAKDCLTGMSEALGLDFVCTEAMARAFENKNPKIQQEALTWLSTAVQEFGLKINVKGILPVVSKALAATNPGVRSAAIALLGVMYMYMGDTLRVLFDNEKPALLQQIDAEFEKVKGVNPPAPTRKVMSAGGKDDEEDEDGEENGEENEGEVPVQDLVPRNDISEKITEALLTELADKNWKVRAEALQKVTTILSEAKFVTPNLGSLPEALKARLGESNKNLQMVTIGILQTLATALGPHCKGHVKVVGPGLLACLADSKPALREKVVACLNAWVENTSLLPLVECEALHDALKMENPFLKAELLGWLSLKLPSHKQLPVELRATIPSVLAALEDRNADVRKKAGEALVPFMIHTGYDAFLKALGKCKPSSKDQIQPMLEKARGELPAKPVKTKKAASAPSSGPAAPRPSAPKSAPAAPPADYEEEDEPTAAAPAKAESKAKVVKGKAKGKAAPPSSSKKKEEEDFGPTMTMTVMKEQRVKEEKAMKILKWNFLELKQEYVEQLRNQMEKNFNRAVMADLFHTDFKSHIKAIEQLIKCIETQEKETINNLDLLLKWVTIRFYDTNPSMLNKALDYLQRLFSLLSDIQYHLTDLEANSFIPYLLLKSGDPKDNVRRDVRNILKMICKVLPACKMFSFLIDGLKCKVAKQRTELLDELGCLIDSYGMNVCQPSPAHALKIIAAQIGDRDNAVRNAALNTIVVAYTILGETVYKYIGHLNDKDQSLLDERIKRAMKNREMKPAAKEPVQAQPPPQQQQQRPKTTPGGGPMAKAASQPNMGSRPPVNKAYQLDIEIDDWEPVYPSLIELDLDSVMAPITKPKLMARPASPMSAKLVSSTDVSSSISSVVVQISSVDINTCVKALAQIDEVMKDPQKVDALADHVDKLLVVITMQNRLGISMHVQDPSVDRHQVVCLYRCLLSTLISIFNKTSLGKKASTHILMDLIQSLLTVLLDPHIDQLQDGSQIIKSVNLTVVKIINKSDPTNITCANIALMRECLKSDTCSKKFLELVIKCLWKNMNLIPATIEELNCDRLLYESHLFFQQFPSSSWRTRPNLDLPIRTVKTLLHNLTKLKGHKILSHTGLISASEESEVEGYLHTVLAKSKTDEGSADKSKIPPKNKRVSKTHELLTEIFKKIGTKENTREGLNDLFDFKKKFPEADMNPFLKKTAPSFQKYISNMLAEIEEERRGSKATGNYSHNSISDDSANVTSEAENFDVDFYREKLRELRAKCGLDNNSGEGQTSDSNRTSGSKTSALVPETSDGAETPETEIQDRVAESRQEEEPRQSVDVSVLRARLDRIKKMSKS